MCVGEIVRGLTRFNSVFVRPSIPSFFTHHVQSTRAVQEFIRVIPHGQRSETSSSSFGLCGKRVLFNIEIFNIVGGYG